MEVSNILLICLLSITCVTAAKLPEKYKRCAKKNPNFDKCLVDVIADSIQYMSIGEPSLGILPMDPLTITALDIGKNGRGSVDLELKFRNISIAGLGQLVIPTASYDFDKNILFTSGYVNGPLHFKSKYEVDGKVLILPLRGKGDCKLKIDNVVSNMTVTGKMKMKNGERYWDVQKTMLYFTTSKLHIKMDGLLGAGTGKGATVDAVGEQMNKFLNENWFEIFDELRPALEEALGAALGALTKGVFSKIPFDDIFY